MTHPEPTPESVAGTLAELRDFVDRETRQGSLSRSIGGAIISRIERIAATPQADRGDGLREALEGCDYVELVGDPLVKAHVAAIRAALRDTAPSGLDMETLRRALDGFLTERGEYRGITPERLAAEYSWVAARLRESADQERTEG